MCLRLYKKDINNTVKDSALQPIIKMLKYFEPKSLEKFMNLDELMCILLDEIKLSKPTATG